MRQGQPVGIRTRRAPHPAVHPLGRRQSPPPVRCTQCSAAFIQKMTLIRCLLERNGTAKPHGWLPRKCSMGQVTEQIPMGSMTRWSAVQRFALQLHMERAQGAQRSAASTCWADCSVQAERRGSGLCFPITFLLLLLLRISQWIL